MASISRARRAAPLACLGGDVLIADSEDVAMGYMDERDSQSQICRQFIINCDCGRSASAETVRQTMAYDHYPILAGLRDVSRSGGRRS